jgi:hypothetical protein
LKGTILKNYNMFALEGDPSTSDIDVCQTLGLDIDLAGTPAINEAAIEAMMRQNVSMMVRSGMSEAEAQQQASILADQSRKRVQEALSNKQ